MKPTIGFVLVTHTAPAQALRLCWRLNEMFGLPPIAVHHDFGKAPLDRGEFPGNVRFVEQWVNTGWGTIGVVDALLLALRLLYLPHPDGWGDPDWFVSLSAADYPMQTADVILNHLRQTHFDGFLDCRTIADPQMPYRRERPGGEFPFDAPLYQQIAFRRYMAISWLPYRMARRLNLQAERYCLTAPALVQKLTPFHDGVKCFAGDAWMTMRRQAAHLLLENSAFWQQLYKHFASRAFPEEAIYQTFLFNLPSLQISPDTLRYTDWRGERAHPRTLNAEDIPLLLQSRKHFARKVPNDSAFGPLLDQAVAQAALQNTPSAQPAVTVIIPSYNCAALLPRAIESALAQTFTSIAVIVVDDGSTDDTARVVQPYLSHIRYIRQNNKGLPGARNAGIRASRSPFVALLDADDAWVPEKLALQMTLFDDPAVDIVYSDFRVEYSDGNVKESYLAERPLASEGDVTEAYIQSRFLFPSSMVLRREAMEACGLFDETMLACEDIELFTKMCLRGKVARIDRPLMIRSEGSSNITANGEKMQHYTLRAFHHLLGNVAMPKRVRRVMRKELGLNYFHRGYQRFRLGKMSSARRDLLQAIRYLPQVRWKAMRVLVVSLFPRLRSLRRPVSQHLGPG